MRVVIFGASGMIGQGVLARALAAPDVTDVLAVVRRPLGTSHAKLREVTHTDFTDYSTLAEEFASTDALLFCLGTTSFRTSEADYAVVHHDYPVAAARALHAANPEAAFSFVTGEGSDRTERGRVMWARVRGRAENTVLALSPRFRTFRPGFIQPLDGARSQTPLYAGLYRVVGGLFPLLERVAPDKVTTTRRLGEAMLAVSRPGSDAPQEMEIVDINRWGS